MMAKYNWKLTAKKVGITLAIGALATLGASLQAGDFSFSSATTTILICVVQGVKDYLKHAQGMDI